jgi:hypothetical protein
MGVGREEVQMLASLAHPDALLSFLVVFDEHGHPVHGGAEWHQATARDGWRLTFIDLRNGCTVGRGTVQPGQRVKYVRIWDGRLDRVARKNPCRHVAHHKSSMMEELGIKSSAELVRYAIKMRIVSQ